MNEFCTSKINRFLSSKKILRIIFYYHKLFGEINIGNIGFDFSNKPSRLEIVSETIKKKKFSTFLEIGCFDNQLFNQIYIDKTGVDPFKGGNIKLKSDQFFKINKKKYDCIFIDGLHTYEQVKKISLTQLIVLMKMELYSYMTAYQIMSMSKMFLGALIFGMEMYGKLSLK